jgi:KDO2-lipid IV(A) lauroyltransferase
MARRKKHPARRAIERFLTRCLAAPAWALVRWLPLRSLRWLGNVLGTVLFLVTPGRQRLADDNLRAVFGERFSPAERRRIRLTVSRNLCKLFLELFKLPTFDRQAIRQLVPLANPEVLHQAVERGRGAIILTGHLGNWELLGARAAAEGFDVAVVARDASDARVAALVNRSRESAGMRVLGRNDLRGMLRQLRSNGCLGILPDQHAKAGSVRMTFLGRPAWVPRGPATLALRTGCALVVGFCIRDEHDGLSANIVGEVELDAPDDRDQAVLVIMERINRIIEEEIRERPEQWLWLHDRWKDIPADAEADDQQAEAAVTEAGSGG